MDQATTPRIRTVALVGHSGAGKTTVAEALLHRAGVIPRAGRVEDGTTVCDTDPEEIRRAMSLTPAVAPFDWTATDGQTYAITLIDTPGYADFAGGVDAALAVADLAVVVVSAVDGVEVGTEAVWRRCAEAGVPRLVFITKEDKPRADFHRVLAQLEAAVGPGLVCLELPLGEEEAFRGVADVLSDQGFAYDADGSHHVEPLPEDVAVEERALHEQVTEEIVSGDDEQLERYLTGEVPSAADLERTLAHEVLDGVAFPVLVGSGTTGVGIDRLADLIGELGPAPRPVEVEMGGTSLEVVPDPDGEPLVHVFRTVTDPFVGQVSVFRVLSGTVRHDDRLVNTTTGHEERLHGLFRLRGTEHLPVQVVPAGEVAAVAKLADSPSGSLLAVRGRPVRLPAPPRRPASYALSLVPVTQSDDDKLAGALQRLCAEDPTLVVDRVVDVRPVQTVLRGLGDLHLAVAVERLARKLGVQVTTEPVRVAYRETIAGAAQAEGKVKKQSGGHGQFAVVQLRVRPAEPGAGNAFVDSVVGGAVPRHFLPAVERGVMEALAAGGPHGYPVVDVVVECYDGKHHAVDSSDMAFRTAAGNGVREALTRAGTVLLEPVHEVEVTVPNDLQGEVLGDLSGRRGRISGSDLLPDGRCRIQALVPEAELARYVLDLRSLTGGRGAFTATPAHYAPAPTPALTP
ncbi:elongation factor G [Actinotalea sp. BY-33]|uniref:Elongation factor G n=1 Tax=Actinotalea soli TaxID=2819234 RepID=A0A939LSW0_9CELL|nr:elongation factor G [Actinotalea soli]MBO1751489.1 elongation factor G [Actinotalea soli]